MRRILLFALVIGMMACSKDNSGIADQKETLEFEFAYEADEAIKDFSLGSSLDGCTWRTRAIIIPKENITEYKVTITNPAERTLWVIVANHANGKYTLSEVLKTN